MSRSEQREKAMVIVYQYLINNRDIDMIINDNLTEESETIDPYFYDVIHTTVSNRNKWSAYIDKVLDNWSFARLGYIEQAILLNGCSEFSLKEVEAPVIIDEAVELAKKYGDEDAYKLINKVLDVI